MVSNKDARTPPKRIRPPMALNNLCPVWESLNNGISFERMFASLALATIRPERLQGFQDGGRSRSLGRRGTVASVGADGGFERGWRTR